MENQLEFNYKCLSEQIVVFENYKIVPIRFQDRYDIMNWRNEQIYHLRQSELINHDSQDLYFANVVSKIFYEEKPNQVLFSYLENDKCIGYGGLVHINWIDFNAEISFVLNTELENKFIDHWGIFLKLIERIGFEGLKLNKLYTYAFDLRPNLYIALEKSHYFQEAKLYRHTFFQNKFIDVVIHSKFSNYKCWLKPANTYQDALFLFYLVNDKKVRSSSLDTSSISIIEHIQWFDSKIRDKNCSIFILTDIYYSNIGQIRIDRIGKNFEIDYSISADFRGRGFGNIIVQKLIEDFPNDSLIAKVKKENIPSRKVFENNSFHIIEENLEIIVYNRKISNE